MLSLTVLLIACAVAGQTQVSAPPAELARQILDDAQPADKRQLLATDNADKAAEMVAAMTADLATDDAAEEYRRIPWIWRVAIAAGKRDQSEPLRALLAVSLPKEGGELRDWQAVVIGGGIINGISLSGKWPKLRIEELLGEDQPLRRRWRQSLAAAAVKADNEKVKTGTRYDALRMIALDPTKEQLARLAKYLDKDADLELQMGAVSGLADVDTPEATKLLSAALPELTKANQELVIDALLRSEARIEALVSLLESGQLAPAAVSEAQRKKLRELPPGKLRDRAEALAPRRLKLE